MIPVLYESNETAFTSNGLGRLSDATTCKVTEERNGEYELEMNYPATGIHFADIKRGRFISAKPAYMRDPQPFEIYNISKPINGVCTIYAQHISYRLSKTPVMPFSANSASAAMDGLKKNAAEPCPFTFSTDKTTAAAYNQTVPNSIRGQLGGTEGSILDVYGGEYEWDKYKVILHDHRGTNNGVQIRYGKNLTDITQEENIENTITGICPYWTGTVDNQTVTVTLPEKVIETASANNFPYHRTSVVDISSKIKLADEQKTPTVDQVRAAANQYIKENNFGVPAVSLTISFQNLQETTEYQDTAVLEQVHLCDTVTVIFEKLGVNATAKVTKTVFNVLKDRYDSITVGEPKSNMSSTMATQAAAIETKPTTSFLTQAVDSATRLITGATGGYVRLNKDSSGNPYELLIMDTDNLNTAKNIWRFNKNGWGHSSTGYNGTYNLAATQDGAIVADMMTAGTLRGIKIQGVDYYGNKKDATGNYIFHVDADGNLTANSAILNNAMVKGTVSAGFGSSLTNVTFNNGNGSFIVDAAGNLRATKGTFTGTVNGTDGSLTNVAISNGNGTFTVDANGNLKATSANISGEIHASKGSIDNLTCSNLTLDKTNSVAKEAVQDKETVTVVSNINSLHLEKVGRNEGGEPAIYLKGYITFSTRTLTLFGKTNATAQKTDEASVKIE